MTITQRKVLNQLLPKDYEGEKLQLGDVVVNKWGFKSKVSFDDEELGFYAGDTPLSKAYIKSDRLKKYYEGEKIA